MGKGREDAAEGGRFKQGIGRRGGSLMGIVRMTRGARKRRMGRKKRRSGIGNRGLRG